MKFTSLWASIALLNAPSVFAQATSTSAASTTSSTSATPSCTASQIASLCDYKSPGPDFAVAIESKASCWEYCNAHSPCSFVIFAAGNPNTGSGTCWLYPGETFDASAGTSDCGSPSLYVYSQPECTGGSSTSADACAATATPSAVATVCGYPVPDDCFSTCSASGGAPDCLSQCAKADSCSYVVFNPHNPDNSPYASGTCWMFSNGTYDAGLATTCGGDPEQYVYENLCPKPSPSPSSSSLTSSPSLSPSTSISSPTTSSPSASSPSSLSTSSSRSPLSPSANAATSGRGNAGASIYSGAGSQILVPVSISSTLVMGMGMVVLLWQGL